MDIVTKTIAQAEEAADVLDTDYQLVQRGNAPAQKVSVAAYRTAIGEKLAQEFATGDLAAALAVAQTVTAQAGQVTLQAMRADAAVERAVMAAATNKSYPNSAATVVPVGVTAVAVSNAGATYTNGVNYIGTFTGGGGAGARFRFDVVGGQITNIRGIEPGYAYTSAPAANFSAAGAGNGAAAVTVTIGHLVLSGEFYFAASADGASERMYQNVSGVVTAVTPAVIRATPTQPHVRLVQKAGSTAQRIKVEPAPGYVVPADPTNAVFDLTITAENGIGAGMLIEDLLAPGDLRQLRRPDGVQVTGGMLKPGTRCLFTYNGTTGRFELLSPTAGPPSSVVDVQMLAATGVMWAMHPVQTLMNNTGIGTVFRVFNPPVRTAGPLTCQLLGINDVAFIEIRGFTGEPGDVFPVDLITGPNHTVLFTKNANGAYQLLSVQPPGPPKTPVIPGSFSAFATRATSAARALTAYGH